MKNESLTERQAEFLTTALEELEEAAFNLRIYLRNGSQSRISVLSELFDGIEVAYDEVQRLKELACDE